MGLLLIDDLRNFRDGRKTTVARNSETALQILKDNTVWDEIWLDHDLGIVDNKLDTIMPVVDFLCEQSFLESPVQVAKIFIHTSNPVGAKQMFTSLTQYGYDCIRVNATEYFII